MAKTRPVICNGTKGAIDTSIKLYSRLLKNNYLPGHFLENT
jgi:hypothetical protein